MRAREQRGSATVSEIFLLSLIVFVCVGSLKLLGGANSSKLDYAALQLGGFQTLESQENSPPQTVTSNPITNPGDVSTTSTAGGGGSGASTVLNPGGGGSGGCAAGVKATCYDGGTISTVDPVEPKGDPLQGGNNNSGGGNNSALNG
ncbi:MAG: hypothetical protein KDD64_12975 [Bdellovibrionales bacterium]|nr:hypothetical protein [Bdellovibrionales bacterium]